MALFVVLLLIYQPHQKNKMEIKAKIKRTRRGCYIVEYGFEHSTFPDLKQARAFRDGFNFAMELKDILSTSPKEYSHISHTHCWDNPDNPCGIPLEKHTQCCLCDLKTSPKE